LHLIHFFQVGFHQFLLTFLRQVAGCAKCRLAQLEPERVQGPGCKVKFHRAGDAPDQLLLIRRNGCTPAQQQGEDKDEKEGLEDLCNFHPCIQSGNPMPQ